MAEILAPCGSLETLTAALRGGADAVYLGGENFSARGNAKNFTRDELKQAIKLCHKRGVKVYQAINTVIFDSQTEDCMQAVKFACDIGIDGLITQDLVLTEIVKHCCPEMPIHASTQMTIHTEDGVEMTKELGFCRTVVSRELPLKIIRKLCGLGIEIEAFVHGALCMSVSGQCYMSGVIGSRSANRGLCAQACRLPCSAVKGREAYALSLKDMSYIDRLGDLVNAGVSSLKIEGRMKRPEYVAAAVDSCKKSLNGEAYDSSVLEDVFSRSGFTNGYLNDKLGSEMFGTRSKEDVKATEKILPKIHEIYRREEKRSNLRVSFFAFKDKNIRLELKDDDGNSVGITGDIPAEAKNKPLDITTAEKHLTKFGDTIYNCESFSAEIDEGMFVSPAQLNELRRRGAEAMDTERISANTKTVKFENVLPADSLVRISCKGEPALRITVQDISQLKNIDFNDIEFAGVPLSQISEAVEKYPKEKIVALMPRFTFDEQAQREELKKASSLGIKKIIAANLAHIKQGREFGLEIHCDYGFNLTNSYAINVLNKLGVTDAVVSFELKSGQINALKNTVPIGIFGYGRLPLMLTVNCPIKSSVGCKSCKKSLWDRTGRCFKVKCSKHLGYVEVMNSDILYLPHKLDKFNNADFITLNFTEESPKEVQKIVQEYKCGTASERNNITSGLYFRGVF